MKLLSLLNITALLALSVNAATLNKRQSACAAKLGEVKTEMDNLFIETQKINLLNAPIQGYKIPQIIAAAVTKGSAYVSACGQNYVYSEADKADIPPAFIALEDATIKAINVVIGKKGLPTLIPFYEPIRVALVQYEAIHDSLVFSLAELPNFNSILNPKASSAGLIIEAGIDAYSNANPSN